MTGERSVWHLQGMRYISDDVMRCRCDTLVACHEARSREVWRHASNALYMAYTRHTVTQTHATERAGERVCGERGRESPHVS